MNPSVVALVVALPLLAAFLLPLVPGSARRVVGPLVLLVLTGIGMRLWDVASVAPVVLAVGDFLPPLGIVFYVDSVAALFVLAVALLCLLFWPWAGEGEHLDRKQSLTLILAAACGGLAVSGDLFNVYVFYELAAVASYGLAAGGRGAAGQVATFRYVILGSLGSLLALFGITLVYFMTGTVNLAHLAELAPKALVGVPGLAAFLLILLGLGVKAELFLVNAWAPEVYATAETRVSALLAGLVSKLALLVLVRLLVLVFPLPGTHEALLVLGLLGMLTGELAAYKARDVRRMLAWSSIGQLGAAFMAFSVPGDAGLVAGIAIALHHMLVKPALFLLAGRWGGSLGRIAGAARRSPLGAVLFVLFALSLLGVPPLPGFWAKYLLLSGLAGQPGGLWWLGGLVVLLTTVVEAVYLFRVIGALYSRDEGSVAADQSATAVAGSGMLAAVLLVIALSAPVLAGTLDRMAVQMGDVDGYVTRVLTPPAPAVPIGVAP
ncbi:MAG TPA: proton-conducting transporter membrane subunit [Parasulfuritortus sp.]